MEWVSPSHPPKTSNAGCGTRVPRKCYQPPRGISSDKILRVPVFPRLSASGTVRLVFASIPYHVWVPNEITSRRAPSGADGRPTKAVEAVAVCLWSAKSCSAVCRCLPHKSATVVCLNRLDITENTQELATHVHDCIEEACSISSTPSLLGLELRHSPSVGPGHRTGPHVDCPWRRWGGCV